MLVPPGQTLVPTEAVLYLDDLSFPLSGEVDLEKTFAMLSDAMQDGGTVELRIISPGGLFTRAVVRPGNARIAYVDPGPYHIPHRSNELGKPTGPR